MSIRFAAAINPASSRLLVASAQDWGCEAANDNCPLPGQDLLLNAALRHFAEHGLAAATHAQRQAEKAFFAADHKAYQWWLGICRTLDRRLARQLDAASAARH